MDPSIREAAERIEEERTPDRGFTTETDLKEKILNLPIVQAAIRIHGNVHVNEVYNQTIAGLDNKEGDSSKFCSLLSDIENCR